MGMIQRLCILMNSEEYNYESVISCLKGIEEFRISYESRNSFKRNYTLEDHTKMVCSMFEKWFAEFYRYSSFGISVFRFMLCLHDIGKPIALIKNDKYNQFAYTIEMIERYKDLFPLSKQEYKILLAIISDDPIGLYVRGKIDVNVAVEKIKHMSFVSGIEDINTFWKLLILYYQVDAGAYTSLGYIGHPADFIEKPKLEKTFKRDEQGVFIYSSDELRFQFSDEIENKIGVLLRKLA